MKRVVKKIISICSVVATVASVSTAISVGVTHYQQMSDSQSSTPIQSTPGEIRNYRTYDSDAQWKLDAGTKPTNANYLLTTADQYQQWGLPWDSTKTAANQPCLLGFTVSGSNATLSYYKFPQGVLIDLVIPDTVTLGATTYKVMAIGTWTSGGDTWGLFAWSGQATTTAGTARYTSTGTAVVSTKECLSLRSVILNDNITSLPKRCFYGCENLQNIWIGEGLNLLASSGQTFNDKLQADYYFCHCPGLQLPKKDDQGNYIKGTGVQVDPLNPNLKTFYSSVNGVEGLAVTLLPGATHDQNVYRIYPGLAIGGVNAESIWSSTSVIPTWSFETCWSLTHVNIGNVNTIETRAFGNCLNLVAVYTNWTTTQFIAAATNSGKIFTTYDPDKEAGNKNYSTASTVGHNSFVDTNDNTYTVLYLKPGLSTQDVSSAWDNNSSNKQKFLLRNADPNNRQIRSLSAPNGITVDGATETFNSLIGGMFSVSATVTTGGISTNTPQDVRWEITAGANDLIDFIDPYNGTIKVKPGLAKDIYTLTVKATSLFDDQIFGTGTVVITIQLPEIELQGDETIACGPENTTGSHGGYEISVSPINFPYDSIEIAATVAGGDPAFGISFEQDNLSNIYLVWDGSFDSGQHEIILTATMTYHEGGNIFTDQSILNVSLTFDSDTYGEQTTVGILGNETLNVAADVAYRGDINDFSYEAEWPSDFTGNPDVRWSWDDPANVPTNLMIDPISGYVYTKDSGVLVGSYPVVVRVISQQDINVTATKSITVVAEKTALTIAGPASIEMKTPSKDEQYEAFPTMEGTAITSWELEGAPSWITISKNGDTNFATLSITTDSTTTQPYYDFVVVAKDEYGNTASQPVRLITGIAPPTPTVHDLDETVATGTIAGIISAFTLFWFLLLLLWKRHAYAVLYRKGKKVKVVVFSKRKRIVDETKEYAAGDTMKSGTVRSVANEVDKIINDKKCKLHKPVMCSHEKEDIEIMADIRKPIYDKDTKTSFCRIKFIKEYDKAKWEKDNKKKDSKNKKK